MKSFVKVREFDEDGESYLIDIPTTLVEVVDIQDDNGKDLCKFIYKGKTYESYIVLKY
jgi:hypothetical protein